MIKQNVFICPKCGGELKYYDSVKRIIRTKKRATNYISLRRLRCKNCNSIHREIPDDIFPYKQYEAEIIVGVVEGLITCETLGFEDYPCELTMMNWIKTFSSLTSF
jgi:uncharacterized Zn finger protein